MSELLEPDPDRMVIVYDNGEDEPVELPACWRVCPRCRGRGVHDAPAFNGFTSEEWADACADDPDFPEQYRRGYYSVPCSQCGGRTTVLEIDRARILEVPATVLEELERERIADLEHARCREAERRMGA